MKRPLTTSFVAPAPATPAQPESVKPPQRSWREAAPIVAALLTTLGAIETGLKNGT